MAIFNLLQQTKNRLLVSQDLKVLPVRKNPVEMVFPERNVQLVVTQLHKNRLARKNRQVAVFQEFNDLLVMDIKNLNARPVHKVH